MSEIDSVQVFNVQSPVIALPADLDPERRKRLEAKLEEYRKRLKGELEEIAISAPELFLDTQYKIAVLAAVLASGSVATHDLSRKVKKDHGGMYDAPTFDNACAVIEDYIVTGGHKVLDASRPFEELSI